MTHFLPFPRGQERGDTNWWCSTEVREALLIRGVWRSSALSFSSHGDTRHCFIHLFHGIWSVLPRQDKTGVLPLCLRRQRWIRLKVLLETTEQELTKLITKKSPSHQKNTWRFLIAFALAFRPNQIYFFLTVSMLPQQLAVFPCLSFHLGLIDLLAFPTKKLHWLSISILHPTPAAGTHVCFVWPVCEDAFSVFLLNVGGLCVWNSKDWGECLKVLQES